MGKRKVVASLFPYPPLTSVQQTSMSPRTLARVCLALSVAFLACATPMPDATCSADQRVAGVQQLVEVIQTHSLSDAAQIPLAPTCSRLVTV